MPVCRQCGRQWPDGYAVCPEDGARLVVDSETALGATGALAIAAAASGDEDLPAGSPAGEYVIEVKLGEGGMGAVYGARHPVIGKRAAIKVIKRELSANPEAVDRFVREAQAVNTIGHPNIVDVFGFGRLADGRSFFVMEWLDGESLRERMTRPLAFADALEILESIATALQAAHEAGVVHRDLKPDNVFLARSKGARSAQVKLLDFGLAKLSGTGAEAGIKHTRTGVVMGTPLYLSPEQAKGTQVDAASDIYSLGVMAYEMATGTLPFMAGSAVEIMALHISMPPAPVSTRAPRLPAAFDELVTRMLAKDGGARPRIAEVVQQLQAIRAQPALATAVSGASAAPATEPGRRRSGRVIALVAAGVVAAGAAAIVVASSRHGHRRVARSAAVGPPDAAAPSPPALQAPEVVRAGSAAPTPVPAPAPPVPPAPPAPVEPGAAPHAAPAHPGARLGKVEIAVVGAPRATIVVDRSVRARGVADVALELTPGEHTVRVEAPGRRPVTRTIHVKAGAPLAIKLELPAKSFNTVHDPFSE